MADSEPLPPTVTLPADASSRDERGYVGQVLDNRYRLERSIGQGGMGSVYHAKHVVIGRSLAVKILDSRRLEDGQGSKRLFREAQTAAGIGHPNIVEVVDVGTTPRGDPYLVMEHLVGEDLASFIKRQGPVPLATAVAILEPVLWALQAAHTRGIVHRDIKPSNIFLVRREEADPDVKLIDFGVAKMMGPNPEGKITVTGALLGTPSYMSPEQAVGMEELDARVDLYAVGVIFYELVTGQLPFYGANYNELLYRIVRDDVPSPRVPDGELPESVRSVIEIATRKMASERYQSAGEMLEALRELDAYTARNLALSELASSIERSVPSSQPSAALVRTPRQDSPATGARTKLSSQASTPIELHRRASGTLADGTTRAATDTFITSRTGLAAAGGTLVVAGIVAVLFVSLATPKAPQGAGAASAVAGPTMPGVQEGVEITIEGAPKAARVLYDRTPVAAHKFRVRRSQLVTPLRVELDGYQPFVTSVVPHEDTTVRVRLEPLVSPVSASAQSVRSPEAAPPKTTGKPKSGPPVRQPKTESGIGKLGRDTYYTEEFE